MAQKYLKVVDNDYYEFESECNNFPLVCKDSTLVFLFIYFPISAHIFFDDAFEISDVCDDWMQVNQVRETSNFTTFSFQNNLF